MISGRGAAPGPASSPCQLSCWHGCFHTSLHGTCVPFPPLLGACPWPRVSRVSGNTSAAAASLQRYSTTGRWQGAAFCRNGNGPILCSRSGKRSGREAQRDRRTQGWPGRGESCAGLFGISLRRRGRPSPSAIPPCIRSLCPSGGGTTCRGRGGGGYGPRRAPRAEREGALRVAGLATSRSWPRGWQLAGDAGASMPAATLASTCSQTPRA